MNLVFDIAAFSVLRTKKFPARREVVKERAHFDLRAWCFTAISHNVNLAAVDENFCAGDRVGFTRSHTKSRYTGDTWQCFAAKPQRGDGLKVGSRTNFAGCMSLERKQRIVAVHPAAVINDTNQRNSAAPNNHIHTARASVETVFH